MTNHKDMPWLLKEHHHNERKCFLGWLQTAVCFKGNIDLYKKFTLHSSRLRIIHLFGFIVPVFLTRSLLTHVNTAQVVRSTALRPCNVFIARLAVLRAGWLGACIGKQGELNK